MTAKRKVLPLTRMKQQKTEFIGADARTDGVYFRVWAPKAETIEVATGDAEHSVFNELGAEGNGYFSGLIKGITTGTLYRYRIDGDRCYPDPSSRSQSHGPHGPSQVVDSAGFAWTDQNWRGTEKTKHIVYEIHVGTFTREGTWHAAAEELPELASLGVTTIEMMPIAEYPGRFGWGYDGVNLFAPSHLYGSPDDLKHFINRAHELGLAVILDVVYNHLGPDGNYLHPFSDSYFSTRHASEWGDTPNFDDAGCEAVRNFFCFNTDYWIREFHFDGLRIDATQCLYDDSTRHIIADLTEAAMQAAENREIFVIAENESQNTKLIRPSEQGGFGIDGIANDDFHHSAMVAMTGRNEAYYMDYMGSPQEFISLAKYGYLYQGQRYEWQRQRRGTFALDIPAWKFVNFLENHDQVANSGRGYRAYMQTSAGRYRAMTAMLLLFPQTPMLFQGQEFLSSKPFFYFADHQPELADKVNEGRAEFLKQFRSLATAEMQALMPNPADPETFVHSKLDLKERHLNSRAYQLHKDLIRLRRENPVFTEASALDGAVLGPECFVLRYFVGGEKDCLLLVNLGRDLRLRPAPEPLLAPLYGMRWKIEWSSEDPIYGGCGTAEPDGPENWQIPGHAAIFMKLVPENDFVERTEPHG